MNDFQLGQMTLTGWIKIPAIFVIWVAALLFVKRIFLSVIQRLASRTQTKIDDILIRSLNGPLTLIVFASFGFVLHRIVPSSSQQDLAVVQACFTAVAIIAIGIFVDRFSIGLLELYSSKIEILKTSGGIVRGVVHLGVFSLGVLILLDTFGISVTPVLTSLGLGSLAVVLAIQPTLENVFSGIQMITDKPIALGQFIKLESGEEGFVHKIGWRSTWIRLPDNNMVILPNKAIVNAKIVNYCYPENDAIVKISVGVHYNSDLNKVEKTAVEVGQDILKTVEGGAADFEPLVRFHTFGDFSIDFWVVLKVRDYANQALVRHEFIKRLHQRFAQEGIIIPYPIQAVNYDQEKAYAHFTDKSELAK